MNPPTRVSRRALLAGSLAACASPARLFGSDPDPRQEPGCVFCQIVAGTRPATFVYEDDRCVAFGSIEPIQPGHLLLVPRSHVATLYELPEVDAAHLLPVASRLGRALKRAHQADGLTLLQNNEKAAGQAVFHFHLHLIPRHAGREIFRRVVETHRATPEELERDLAPVRAALLAPA